MFVMIGCGERPAGAPAGGLLSDSSGIAIWSIPQGERKAPLQVERVRGLALPDTGWTIWIDDVAADPVAEVIYILDQDTPRLLAFRFDGSFVGQIGRQGEGPGEYAAPNAITVEPNGDLLVVDPGTGSLRRWSRRGSYLGSEPLSPPYWGPGFAALDVRKPARWWKRWSAWDPAAWIRCPRWNPTGNLWKCRAVGCPFPRFFL
jgi:hypothetical protein